MLHRCFFARNSEIFGLLYHDPVSFLLAESYEKLSAEDALRWNNFPVLLSTLGIRPHYPVPAFIDVRKPDRFPTKRPANHKEKTSNSGDLFGDAESNQVSLRNGQDIFVAFALYVNEMLGVFGGREFTPGVYWSEFITLSTSNTGLMTSLANYYDYRTTTPMPIYDIQDLKIVIVQIRFAHGVVDTGTPGKSSYTWKKGVAYKQLRHLADHCQSVLERADLDRRGAETKALMKRALKNLDVNQYLDAREAMAEILSSKGRLGEGVAAEVAWEGLYTPSKSDNNSVQLTLDGIGAVIKTKSTPRDGIEFDEVPMACIACSI